MTMLLRVQHPRRIPARTRVCQKNSQLVVRDHAMPMLERYISTASSACSTSPALPSTCSTLSDVHHSISTLFSSEFWRRIQTPWKAGELAHVTSVYQPPSSSKLYTLRVGPSYPSHPIDRFVLDLSRGLAQRVVYTGEIARREAELRCKYHERHSEGLKALRASFDLPPYPHILLFTRDVRNLDWNHPMFSASEEQQVEVVTMKIPKEIAGKEAVLSKTGEVSLPLSSLIASTSISSIAHLTQDKLIKLRFIGENESVKDILLSYQSSSSLPLHPSGFLLHTSLEAGPSFTAPFYQLDQEPSGKPAVQTLLVSVFRGELTEKEERRVVVYPSSLHEPRSPSLTWEFLRRYYNEMSCFQAPGEKWSFYWFERKEG